MGKIINGNEYIGPLTSYNIVVNETGPMGGEKCLTSMEIMLMNGTANSSYPNGGDIRPNTGTDRVPAGKAFYIEGAGNYSPKQLVTETKVKYINCYGPVSFTTSSGYLQNTLYNTVLTYIIGQDEAYERNTCAKLIINSQGTNLYNALYQFPNKASYTVNMYPGSTTVGIPLSHLGCSTVSVTNYAMANFSGNTSLRTLNVNSRGAVNCSGCSNLTTLNISGVGYAVSGGFQGCSSLKSIYKNGEFYGYGDIHSGQFNGLPSNGTVYINWNDPQGTLIYTFDAYESGAWKYRYNPSTKKYTLSGTSTSGWGTLFSNGWKVVNTGTQFNPSSYYGSL
jgi:hypothetical protein